MERCINYGYEFITCNGCYLYGKEGMCELEQREVKLWK